MNGLMWVLYLASILPSLATYLVVILVASFGVILILWFFWEMHYDTTPGVTKPPRKMLIKTIVAVLLSGVICAIIPDKETIYLMAGAKGTEIVVESEAGQEILSDIQEVIKHQLGELKGEINE